MFSLLKPTFSLLLRPHILSIALHPKAERSPTDTSYLTASANDLVPSIFGAKTLNQ
jgi:hypothetical protein